MWFLTVGTWGKIEGLGGDSIRILGLGLRRLRV